jgi:hypothetical protein
MRRVPAMEPITIPAIPPPERHILELIKANRGILSLLQAPINSMLEPRQSSGDTHGIYRGLEKRKYSTVSFYEFQNMSSVVLCSARANKEPRMTYSGTHKS